MMTPDKIGRYLIRAEIGRGGMATVFLAQDPLFGRDVALKILPAQLLRNTLLRARFAREAQTIAALEHPAIVPVYDFGEHEAQPFIVMRYMPGGSLATRLKDGPLSLADAARIFSRIAEALDEAHSRRVIHRDLKPHNILFDARGKAFLSDFGIAKIAESGDDPITDAASIMGTPEYMSPEQAKSEKKIDGRSDIYSLGVVLFQTLTGELPYKGDTPMRMLMAHITKPPPSLLRLNATLPPACDQVIKRAMAKDPQERFFSVRELAAALSAIAFNHPQEQGREGMARYQDSGLTIIDNLPSTEKDSSPPVPATPLTATSQVAMVASLTQDGIRGGAAAPDGKQLAVAGRAGIGLYSLDPMALSGHLAGHSDWVLGVAWSSDGCILASGSRDTTVRLWDGDQGHMLTLLAGHTGWVWSVAWTSSGQLLASGSDDGTIRLWDTSSGRSLGVLTGHVGGVSTVAWGPHGSLLASGGDDGTVRLWDAGGGRELRILTGHRDRIRSVAWSPDGQVLASSGSGGSIRLWDAAAGQAIKVLTGHTGWVERIAWSPDGRAILSGGSYHDYTVRIWDVATGRICHTLTHHTGPVFGIAWLPDGQQFVSVGEDGLIQLCVLLATEKM